MRRQTNRIFNFQQIPEGTPVFIVTLWDEPFDPRQFRMGRRFHNYTVINAFLSEREMNNFLRMLRDRYAEEGENKYETVVPDIFDGWRFIWGPVDQIDPRNDADWFWDQRSRNWRHENSVNWVISPEDVLGHLRQNYIFTNSRNT